MKKGLSLTELAQEIERQSTLKRDFLASTDAIKVVPTKKEVQLVLGDQEPVAINAVAADQIALHTGIPAKYYDRMAAETPELLANNIETWFKKYPTTNS